MEKSYKNQENSSKEEILISAQEYTSILNMQQRILSMLSSGENSTHILNTLCFLAEKLLPNAVASIMIVNENGLMTHRHASINDLKIEEHERKFHWEQGIRPSEHASLSDLGL